MNLIRYKNYSREEIHNIYSPDVKFVKGAGKWGLHGIVSLPNEKDSFIFFVTFGAKEAGHIFDEGITEDGVLTWQSQPGQKLRDPQIKKLVNHNHYKNDICLLLRTKPDTKFTYLGKLAYHSHNPETEKPVQFQWQIIDWKIENELFKNIGLSLRGSDLYSDPFTPKTNFKFKNQLVKSEKLPFPKKKRNVGKTGSNIVKTDHIKKAISSQKIGKNGELLVVKHEQQRLKEMGIIKKVNHVSLEGDGHGYDIESFNESGDKIFIEVKTTIGGKNTSFEVSSNEVLVSDEKKDLYFIYRLYNYNKEMNSAEFYIINGSISDNFHLTETQYSATFKGQNND